MLDVDHFKKFNDNYGHPSGDACLRQIASVIAMQVTRPADLPARYGGEEFVVLLPATSQCGVATVAERIREAVAALQIPHAYSCEKTVTVSIGGATVDPCSIGMDPTNLIVAADTALYEAKRDGRNRFKFASSLTVADEPLQENLRDLRLHV